MYSKELFKNPMKHLLKLTELQQVRGSNGFRQPSSKTNGGAKHRKPTFLQKLSQIATKQAGGKK